MPRPLRICKPDLTYHVYSRCLEKRDLFSNDFFKDILLEVIKHALDIYDFKIIAYQIMDNHFHFVIKTTLEGPSISRIVQYIKARCAERYNKIMERTGPFWNERFKDKIIEYSNDPGFYLNWLLWYMAYNPVRKKFVHDPRDYKFGSINSYLKENHSSPVEIYHHELYLIYGKNHKERLSKFLLFEEVYRKRLFPAVL